MNMLLPLLEEKLVRIELEANTKDEILVQLTELLFEQKKITCKKQVLSGLQQRELQGSTGIGHGIAIPHAKLNEVTDPCLVVCVQKQGVVWNSMDGEPVRLIIAILLPERSSSTEHLIILRELCCKLLDENFRNRLLQAASPRDLIKNLLDENCSTIS